MNCDQLSALRRRLHAHAEPGFLEFFTAATVISELEEAGIPYVYGSQAMDFSAVGEPPTEEECAEWAERAIENGASESVVRKLQEAGTAIVATVKGNRPGPVWGLRVDMDALPVVEASDEEHRPQRLGFRSETPYMHACGHDGHTTIGVALSQQLSDGDFPGELRIFFQPAEEGVRGAVSMLAAGVTKGVDRMLAVHLGGGYPVGTVIGGTSDAMATTKWRVDFEGEAAHAAASPDEGRNALAAAAQASLALLGMSRFSASDTRVNVGTFHVDGGANIVPAHARIRYELRALDNEVLAEMNRRANAIIDGASSMYGVETHSLVTGSSAFSQADEEILQAVEKAAQATSAIDNFQKTAPMGGSDDAHLFINSVQQAGGKGGYMLVGAANPAPHHNPHFDIDEASLPLAVELLEHIIRQD